MGAKRAQADDQDAAIYCRISRADDEDQTSVERQERLCQDTAGRLGLRVDPRHVFKDHSRSAWKRNRKRPGWDELLKTAREGKIRHILVYHPDRLMRQPWDLEELLRVADDQSLMLHGQANRRDLSNPDDRFFLRIEVAHACRSSDDTSRRVRDALADQAGEGKMHGGRRRFGYEQGGKLNEAEAKVVRDVFRQFLQGEAIARIAKDLVQRGITTAEGAQWTPSRVRQLIDSPHVAGLRVFRGEIMRDEEGAYLKAAWDPCVTVGEWEEGQRLRQQRSIDHADERRNQRNYLLRGLVICGKCGRSMVGSTTSSSRRGGYPTYVCADRARNLPDSCRRRIGAEKLEEFMKDAAIKILKKLSATGTIIAQPAVQDDEPTDTDSDEQRLVELKEMWISKEITTAEYREMRAAVVKRITEANRATVVRPLVALEDVVTGPGAEAAFRKMPDERKAAVLRFLYAAVRIGPSTAPSGQFDYDRIDPEENKLF